MVSTSSSTTLCRQALALALLLCSNIVNAQNTIRQILEGNDNLSLFRSSLSAIEWLEEELDDPEKTFTVFAPTDDAIRASAYWKLYMEGIEENPVRWKWHLHHSCMNHIIADTKIGASELFDGTKNHIFSLEDSLIIAHNNQVIGGARMLSPNLEAVNGYVHVMDKVMNPDFYAHSFEELERQSEFGPDWLDRVSMQTIVDHLDARSYYTHLIEEGQTHVGCRIRALNRIGLFYLPKTLNRSPEIKFGEFLNESFKEETKYNLIEYSLIHKNYYRQDMADHYMEWIMAANGCSHVLVTKSDTGRLCFNDGCQVATPKPREFLANNGQGYVVDKCIVCSGVAMLLEYAAVYTPFNLKDAAQFWETSEWNLRNLSMSAGNGGPVTVLASIDNAFNEFNAEDVARISTDKWKRHQWNFLHHQMIQGTYLEEDFVELWYNNSGRPYNITMISGENATFDYDEERKKVMVYGNAVVDVNKRYGDMWFSNLKGIDGLLHFTAALPQPKSVTHSVYDLINEWENFTTQITYIDTVFLKQDLQRLIPITGLASHNDDWNGKYIALDDISTSVLENHLFAELWWCDTLRGMVGEELESHNGQLWTISLNETTNMPCFDYVVVFGGEVRRSCITKCDILARNGIVHQVDKVLFFEVPRTRGPSIAKIPTYRHPSSPTFHQPPTQPRNGWYLPRPTFYGQMNPAYSAKGEEGYGGDSAATTTVMGTTVAVLVASITTMMLWMV
eukprot:CAMPEP_0172453626 /NCGR_PEP_ID=MMETSP1065-20121228/10853_1 /TAXON_ID=265537 /ORGANISM="Amphiprora paludosa, Strain CCMP125" /LENGTH=731 /DNA_ID=CAMNT_0013205811 /DNA_START=128 /DNA_END=2323 /DNA_ORIENTATION=-